MGRTSLVIGLVALAAAIALGDFLATLVRGSRIGGIVRDSLTIGGWVSMWRPLEVFLYDWWPIRNGARLSDRLAGMPIRIRYTNATGPDAWGVVKTMQLAPRTVADFYRDFMSLLQSAEIAVKIWHVPVEIPSPIPFDEDRVHAAYDPTSVEKFWRILLSVDSVFQRFRSRFLGKCSPVHFFWGSFDLVVTRFSGRRAPERPGTDAMTREAYSHEVSSVGFWPGSGEIKEARFLLLHTARTARS